MRSNFFAIRAARHSTLAQRRARRQPPVRPDIRTGAPWSRVRELRARGIAWSRVNAAFCRRCSLSLQTCDDAGNEAEAPQR